MNKIQKTLNRKKLNLPNKITILRIMMIPFVFGFLIAGYMMLQSDTWARIELFGDVETNIWILIGGGLFVIAAFTDFLDGYYARKLNQVTTFGKFLDPIADKVLVNGTLIILSWANLVPVWVVILFLLRDILVDAARMITASKSVVVAANIFGKLKTVAQMVAIPLIIFIGSFHQYGEMHTLTSIYSNEYQMLLNIPMFIACTLSLFSGIVYLKNMGPYITESM